MSAKREPMSRVLHLQLTPRLEKRAGEGARGPSVHVELSDSRPRQLALAGELEIP